MFLKAMHNKTPNTPIRVIMTDDGKERTSLFIIINLYVVFKMILAGRLQNVFMGKFAIYCADGTLISEYNLFS